MNETCKNGHPRIRPDGMSNTYVYPQRPGRKPKVTCRICRDGEAVERASQDEKVASLAAKELARVVPKKLNAYGEIRFWVLCREIADERNPLRMAFLMAQIPTVDVAVIREASDLLERAIYVFDAHEGDLEKIEAKITKAREQSKSKEEGSG
jgi:hypothetical protein